MKDDYLDWSELTFPENLRPFPLRNDLTVDADSLLDNNLMAFLEQPDNFLFVAPEQCNLHKDTAQYFATSKRLRPDVEIFYADEIYLSDNGKFRHVCKPQLSAAMLIANNYIGFPLIIHGPKFKEILKEISQIVENFWFELCILAVRKGLSFNRIAEFLIFHKTPCFSPSVDDRIQVLERQFGDCIPQLHFRQGMTMTSIEMRKAFTNSPAVTLLVHTDRARPSYNSDAQPYILDLLQNLKMSCWPMNRLNVLVSDPKGMDSFYEADSWPFQLNVVKTIARSDETFNYAQQMNALWRQSETEQLIIMQDTLATQDTDWIEGLLTFSTEPDVAGVSGCILSNQNKIEHVGVVGGIFERFAQPWRNIKISTETYQNWARLHRDYCAVDGALFATRKSVLERVNGFDETLPYLFYNIDTCLKMKMLGYRIVYTPFVCMMSKDISVRNLDLPGSQIITFLNRWRDVIMDDPMYHPRLSRDSEIVRCYLDN